MAWANRRTCKRSVRRFALEPRIELLERRDVPAVVMVGDPGTTVGEAYRVGSLDDTYVGAMERADDVDVFAIDLRQGQKFQVTVTDSWNQNERKSGLWPHVIIFKPDLTSEVASGYHNNRIDSFSVSWNKRVDVDGTWYVGISTRGNDDYSIVSGGGTVVPTFHPTTTGSYQLTFQVEGGAVVPPAPVPIPEPTPQPTPDPTPTPSPDQLADLVSEQFEYVVLRDHRGTVINGPVPLGEPFRATVVVRNNGAADAGQFTVRLYLSTDSVIDQATDVFIANLGTAPGLARGQDHTFVMQTLLPLDLSQAFYGIVRFGIVVDADNQVVESNEENTRVQDVQLYDPVPGEGPITTRTFSTRAAAEGYLRRNRFVPRPLNSGLFDSGWSRPLSNPVFSRFNGAMMPGFAFRIQANPARFQANRRSTRWRVDVEGAEASFNPARLSTIFGEPSVRISPASMSQTLGLQGSELWFSYVADWHRRF